MCMTKMKYKHVHKHALDFEDKKYHRILNKYHWILKLKSETPKHYMKSQRMVNTKTIRKMKTDSAVSRDNI